MTELAQSLKAAAENATPGEWCSDDQYGIVADAGLNGNYYIASCSGPEHRQNKRFIALANPANILALVEALEKAQQRNAELESFRTAYMEWGDKTDWVRTDRRFDVVKPLGKHLADVLRAYIEHLESRTVKLPKPKNSDQGWKIDPEFINKVQDAIGYDDTCECWEGTPSMELVEAVLLAAAGIKREAE
ncbi:ead/Ea22-like family protein [Klebsiella michiganensis]|nr:ead/Ea22-like family protein [Klebsiella michiganensis]MBG2682369.1 ead/Ea22-like family protein [Klebsiella michiganensis]